MKSIFTLSVFVACSGFSHAGVMIYQGQTYHWNFTLNQGGGTTAAAIHQDHDRLTQGERIRFDFYEDAWSEAPLYTTEVLGSSYASSGFFWLDFSQKGFFQDRDGVFSVTMASGSVYLSSLYICTAIEGKNYFASIRPTAIPEPSTAVAALGIVGFVIALLKRKRRPTRLPERSCCRVHD